MLLQSIDCFPVSTKIIHLIGDGMGVAEVFAGLTANGGHLFLDNFKRLGFSKTQYIDLLRVVQPFLRVKKTYNGTIVVNTDTMAIKTILNL